jgi:hypothetical protein
VTRAGVGRPAELHGAPDGGGGLGADFVRISPAAGERGR